MDPIPAIDMWAPIVPAHEVMAHIVDHFPPPPLGDLRNPEFTRRHGAMAMPWCNAARLLGLPS
jgi:hypothetical protein